MILDFHTQMNLKHRKLVSFWILAFAVLVSSPSSFAKEQCESKLPVSLSEEAKLVTLATRVPNQGQKVFAEIVREDQCSTLDWKFLYRLGEVFENAKQFDRAEIVYSMSISRLKPLLDRPNPKTLTFTLAVYDPARRLTTLYLEDIDSRIQQKKPTHEIDSLFEKALKLAPRNVELWSKYSRYLRECGRENEAADAEIKVLKFRPTYLLSH